MPLHCAVGVFLVDVHVKVVRQELFVAHGYRVPAARALHWHRERSIPCPAVIAGAHRPSAQNSQRFHREHVQSTVSVSLPT